MSGKNNRAKNYQARRRRGAGESNEYEEHLPDGFFDMVGRRAAINAINENRAMNLPVTGLKDGWVVREMPDGKYQQISEVKIVSHDVYKRRNLVKGTVIHVGKRS
ncbi:hypothetical protein [Chitinophaga arvensicola]|uniref:Uncharacterized protein n=1 Tax=Chitinophaga arvensicola TaxID=29529 RepID=A0A1I0RHE9_9BACT|nr:hypothetical protein [Chitinophaga arvensicola]SEW40256.1 hypothetical protein SAMN04488122_2836 [Chitinophaga arvensicola]